MNDKDRAEKAESESSRLLRECEGLRADYRDLLGRYFKSNLVPVTEEDLKWAQEKIAALSRQEPAPKPETGTELVKPLEVAPPFDPSYIEYYKKKSEPEAAPDILRIAKNAGEALAEASRSENPMPEAATKPCAICNRPEKDHVYEGAHDYRATTPSSQLFPAAPDGKELSAEIATALEHFARRAITRDYSEDKKHGMALAAEIRRLHKMNQESHGH